MSITEQQLERMSHEDAFASALQSIGDAAHWLLDGYQEWNDLALVPLGRLEDLQSAIDAARALGWQTTDEALDAQDMFYGKGTGFR